MLPQNEHRLGPDLLIGLLGRRTMPSDNMALISRAYEAPSRDDLETMLGFVDPNVQWTYLAPNLPNPSPRCAGAARRWRQYSGTGPNSA